ncbi:hypothetical protein B0A54_15447 [Friedmanniomyces endolithicus]|uniref:Enoyl reductase (ER) domain-containing protein n=1 Tax=Friedmanniomyces endolithicus TaxID=329885 RepID=A0A4U0UB46_9PEZI|nr:hypothetical protein B0A54_15447 [Friedmanniomyces endolithicus]
MANQAWQLTAPGTITLNDLETPIPKPGPNQALVRIHAVALNPGDILLANFSDKYPVKAKLGQILATDGAGVVEEPGPDSIWKKGDRVVIHPSKWLSGPQENMTFDSFAGTTADGMLRRWLVWDDDRLFRAPSHLSLEEASTLFVAGVTAYRALFYGSFRPQPGMTVLTEGTGGVSCFAILFAKAAGMKVIATSSSDEKLEVARKLGADAKINYRKIPECQILGGALTIFGQAGSGSKEVSDEMSAFVEKHRLRPQIARVFEWEEADQALKAMERLEAPGKIVIRV